MEHDDINIKAVAEQTYRALSYIDSHVFKEEGSFSHDHLGNILLEVSSGEVTGCKAHRYVGWAQAAICMYTNTNSSVFQDLNRKYKRKV